MLFDAVVVDHDGSAAEIHATSDRRISDVGEVRRLRSFPQRRVLDLHEIPDFDTRHQVTVRSQVRHRSEHDVIVQATRLDHTLAFQMHSVADHRCTLDDASGFDQGVGANFDTCIYIHLAWVNEADPGFHMGCVDPTAHGFCRQGEIGPGIDAETLLAIFQQQRFNVESVLHRVADNVGQVQLTLLIVVF